MAARYHHMRDTGRVRLNNQDRILVDELRGLWVFPLPDPGPERGRPAAAHRADH